MAERVYGVLLRLYPREFRLRYESGMRDVFARDLARVRADGAGAVVRFWTRTTLEAAAFGVAERLGAGRGVRPSSAGTKGPIMGLGFLADIRDGVRSLRATPVVSAVAVKRCQKADWRIPALKSWRTRSRLSIVSTAVSVGNAYIR
jgi:hypothetical protein